MVCKSFQFRGDEDYVRGRKLVSSTSCMDDDHEDLFGDEEDADHFFLPEHYAPRTEQHNGELSSGAAHDEAIAGDLGIDADSIGSDGLDDDEDLPEEEEADNPAEDFSYEELIAQAQRNVEKTSDDRGSELHLPDLGGLPAAATGAMARWMAGVEQSEDVAQDDDAASFQHDHMSREEILHEYYPSFKRNATLDFSDLFSAKVVKYNAPSARRARQCVPSKISLDVELESGKQFRGAGRRQRKHGAMCYSGVVRTHPGADEFSQVTRTKQDVIESDLDEDDMDLIMACDDWEGIIDSAQRESDTQVTKATSTFVPPRLHFVVNSRELGPALGIYDGKLNADSITLDLNDPRLALSAEHKTVTARARAARMFQAKRYNHSNDEAYALLQETHQSRVRSNLTQLTLEHAGIADRLQSPYYKTLLSKAEARAYHRPTMTFRANQEIRFSRVKPRKKKDKDRSKDPKVLLSTTKDLSLSDNAGFVCLEYSEEYPTILSNAGMAAKVINYYRKRTEEDENRPDNTYGEPLILGITDRSPFWNFGAVEPGETTQAIYNNMYRAPIFKHTPARTDFLLVKASTKLGNRFYLRNLKHIFAVGQTLPVVDIPGPHSRKVTTSYKNRLKMITYRLLRKDDQQRLLVRDLIKHFPDQNDLQIRQRLKDFMEFQRKGEDQNFWKLKAGDILPSEEATRAMIDPETVCLIESMQVGQRHLEDSGYGKSAEVDDDQDNNMSSEQQLAPWIATRNFINATQGKAMLQLYGEGDPTGRGEGISFIRTSMKGGFKVAGESVNDTLENDKPVPKGAHAYNVAKQQKAYEDEIARIWNAQKSSLSMTDDQVSFSQALENNPEADNGNDWSPAPDRDTAQSPGGNDSDEDMMSMNSAMSASNLNKVLKIQRVSRDEDGNVVTTTEVVRDPHVIHAYVQKRRLMEEEDINIDGGEIERTNDEEKNKRMKKRLEDELAKLRRNAERRRIRKIQKEAGLIKSKSKKARAEEAQLKAQAQAQANAQV